MAYSKAALDRLTERVRERSKSSDDIELMDRVIAMQLDHVKDRLVDASGDEIMRLQGEARAYKAVARLINRHGVMPIQKEQ